MGQFLTESASVAQLDVRPTGDQKVAGWTPAGIKEVFTRCIFFLFLFCYFVCKNM